MPNKVPTYKPPRPPGPSRHREYDRTRRDRRSKAFYHTAAWVKLRAIRLAEVPYCEDHLERGELVPATHVHHVVEVKDDWSRRLELENLRSLCASCHSRLHGQDRSG